MLRPLCLALVSIALAACAGSTSPGADRAARDAGPDVTSVPAPDGGDGVCCAMSEFRGCSPGDPGVPAGGWAASGAECADHVVAGFDGCPFVATVDSRGCPVLEEPSCSCPCGRAFCDGGK